MRRWSYSTDWHYDRAHITPCSPPALKQSFRLRHLQPVGVHCACVPSRVHFVMEAFDNYPLLQWAEDNFMAHIAATQSISFLLVDPNGPTRDGWCAGGVLPQHRYRPHWQTVAWEPGLLLLGAFSETLHNLGGTPIKKKKKYSVWLTTEQTGLWHVNTHMLLSMFLDASKCAWPCCPSGYLLLVLGPHHSVIQLP